MALALLDLDEAMEHLRIDPDSDADEAWLELAMQMVSDAIVHWLGGEDAACVQAQDSQGDWYVVTDSHGDPFIHPTARLAALIELASQYRFRDGSDAARVPNHWGHGYALGIGATALLTPLRASRIA